MFSIVDFVYCPVLQSYAAIICMTCPRKALKLAVEKAGILNKRVSCHTFRHSLHTFITSWA